METIEEEHIQMDMELGNTEEGDFDDVVLFVEYKFCAICHLE